MSLPPISALNHLGNRGFSFYPPILNIEHNEWFFRRGTWSDILVVNSRSALEIWIPRRFLGEVSLIEDPVVIVGLVKELEYKAGAVWPHQRRVIEMPMAVGERPRPPQPRSETLAPVIGIRTESVTDSRVGKLVGLTILASAIGVTCFIGASVFREGSLKPRAAYNVGDQKYLELTGNDGYDAILRLLGPPAEDHWQTGGDAAQFRRLWYPERGYSIILKGDSRNTARYIGAVDTRGNPIYRSALGNGGSTFSTLKSLKKF
jgi:hypothetical protein